MDTENTDYNDLAQAETSLNLLKTCYLQKALCLFETKDGLSYTAKEDSLHAIIYDLHTCHTRRAQIEEFLEEEEIDPNQQNALLQDTPLHLAARLGQGDTIRLLVKHGADPNRENRDGFTALDIASMYGHLNSVRCLLAYDANPNKINNVLKRSVRRGHVEIVQYLIEAHQIQNEWIINILTAPCSLPVIREREYEQSHIKEKAIIHCLLDKVDIIQTPEETRYDILFMALHYDYIEALKKFVQHLLDNDQNANVQDEIGRTLLHFGAYYYETLEVLLTDVYLPYNLDLNIQNDQGETALYLGTSLGESKVVKALLQNGADPNIQERHEEVPLHRAGNDEMVSLLLSKGADPNIRNHHGETALHFAVTLNLSTIIPSLLAHPNTDPNIQNNSGETTLHISAQNGDLPSTQHLLEHPQINLLLQESEYGNTALHIAAFNGHLEIVKCLTIAFTAHSIKHDTPNTIKRETALQLAVMSGHLPIVQYLLQNGAKLEAKNSYKDNAFHYAAFYNQPQIFRYLLDYLSRNYQNAKQRTILHARDQFGKSLLKKTDSWRHGSEECKDAISLFEVYASLLEKKSRVRNLVILFEKQSQ